MFTKKAKKETKKVETKKETEVNVYDVVAIKVVDKSMSIAVPRELVMARTATDAEKQYHNSHTHEFGLIQTDKELRIKKAKAIETKPKKYEVKILVRKF